MFQAIPVIMKWSRVRVKNRKLSLQVIMSGMIESVGSREEQNRSSSAFLSGRPKICTNKNSVLFMCSELLVRKM